MDTITTDSGKVLKLEELYVIDDPHITTFGGDPYAVVKGGYLKLKRVWVLVEVE